MCYRLIHAQGSAAASHCKPLPRQKPARSAGTDVTGSLRGRPHLLQARLQWVTWTSGRPPHTASPPPAAILHAWAATPGLAPTTLHRKPGKQTCASHLFVFELHNTSHAISWLCSSCVTHLMPFLGCGYTRPDRPKLLNNFVQAALCQPNRRQCSSTARGIPCWRPETEPLTAECAAPPLNLPPQ